jgi:hypothetical protein
LGQKREPYRCNLNTVFNFDREPYRTVPKYGPFTVFLMVKTEKLMIFGLVRFVLFVKSLKTVRFLEQYGSRYKILTENGNELCTVRFALFIEKTEHGGLFGAVRLAGKNRNGKRFFCNGTVSAFR